MADIAFTKLQPLPLGFFGKYQWVIDKCKKLFPVVGWQTIDYDNGIQIFVGNGKSGYLRKTAKVLSFYGQNHDIPVEEIEESIQQAKGFILS